MKKLIAKTQKGKEFLHSKENAFYASQNARKIVDLLNEHRYKLNDENEIWHVYDLDLSQQAYVSKKIWLTKSGSVKVAYI